jgi:hypothetical protein
MKKFLLISIASLSMMASTAVAQSEVQADTESNIEINTSRGGVACSCYELDRRVQGLRFVVQNARLNRDERQSLRQEVQLGRAELQRSQNYNLIRQERICSRANQQLNYSWVQWQPWIARNRADIGNRCY